MSAHVELLILRVDAELLAVLVAAAVAIAAGLARSLVRGTAARHRPSAPAVFSYWYALVPFEDIDDVKERPVLVLRRDDRHARVLKVTSKAKPGRTNYRRVDTSRWDRPGQRAGSWLQMDKVVSLPLTSFRRHLGDEQDAYFTQELIRIHADEFL
jgi:mRNA-degrading endonuclease toxin of MazEF toxin-antitoxin module